MFHDMIGFEASISGLSLETKFFLPQTHRQTHKHTESCMEVALPPKKGEQLLILKFLLLWSIVHSECQNKDTFAPVQ